LSFSEGTRHVWIYDIARGTLDRISSDGNNFSPIWTPDGKRIVYEQFTGYGLSTAVWAPADRSAPPSALTSKGSGSMGPSSVSADGKLVVGVYHPNRGFWALTLDGSPEGDKPRSILESDSRKSYPDLSPDGHWIAYSADDTGPIEIYVSSYPEAGPRITISNDGGAQPRWSRSGRELFYRSGNKMMAVDVQFSPAFRASRPKALFEGNYRPAFDVTADGQRFLMIKPAAAPPQALEDQAIVVLNWLEEVRRRVPAGGK
jgi:serine/threonine-protein kinase